MRYLCKMYKFIALFETTIYCGWYMGVKYEILENARYGARRFGSVWFYGQPTESEIPHLSRATRVMCAVCGIVRWGAKGWNIAVYTVSIRIQDIVDIQNILQDIGSTQDIVLSYFMAHKMEYSICLYTQDIGLNSEGGRGERVGRRIKPQDIVRYKR